MACNRRWLVRKYSEQVHQQYVFPEQNAIAKEILQLTRTLSGVKINEVMQGERKLKPIILKLNGKAAWDNNIRVLAQATTNRSCSSSSSSHTTIIDTVCYPINTHINKYAECLPGFLACPACRKVEHNTQHKFQTYDLDVKIKCFHCGSKIRVMDWKCSCDIKWYKCNLHAKPALQPPDKRRAQNTIGAQCTTKARVERWSQFLLKRQHDAVCVSSHEDDRDQTPHARTVRARRPVELSPWVFLGNLQDRRAPRVLGPVLATRFPHLYRSP